MSFVLLLSQSTVELEPRDRNRKTPLDLAAKHGHQDIIKFLENEKRRRNTFLPVFLDIWTLVFGQSGRTRGPLLFFLGSVLLWAYPMYFLRVRSLVYCKHCTFGKSVQRDVGSLEKSFLHTGWTKMPQSFRIAH